MNRLLLLFPLLCLMSCASAPPPSETLSVVPSAFVTPSPPIDPEVSPFLVNVMMNGEGPFAMLVDTGSTQSAIFATAATKLDRPFGDKNQVRVRGLSSVVDRPLVRDIDIDFGPFEYEGIDLIGLPDRIPPRFDGIIGIDILRNFVMVFDDEKRVMVFIPRDDVPEDTFRHWVEVETIPPPSGDETFGIAFLEGFIGNRRVTVLIDSGTALSIANWETALFSPRVRNLRNQLRRQWQLEGANSPFRPRALVKLENLSLETFEWLEPQFLLSDLSTLDVLGADEEPFMIVGIDLLAEQSFAIDVSGGRVWFEPSLHRRRGQNLPRIVIPLNTR